MNLKISYTVKVPDISPSHKVVGWKRLGFKKKEYDGYDEYIFTKSIPFSWVSTLKTTDQAMKVIRDLYNSIHFIGEYDFSLPKRLADGFDDAETYIYRLKTAYIGSNLDPDLLLVSKMYLQYKYYEFDSSDVLKLEIEDYKKPELYGLERMKPRERSSGFACPVCQSWVFRNYDGCCNCKQPLDWA